MLLDNNEEVPVCILCGQKGINDPFAGALLSLSAPFFILKCQTCHLRWLNPRPTSATYEKIYREIYYSEAVTPEEYSVLVAERTPIFSQRLDRILRLTGPGAKLLDVGAAKGDFVAMARELGMVADGLEPSDWARGEALREHGISLKTGDMLDVPSNHYDVVHLNHVFEHLLDPIRLLVQVRRILRDRGLLVIEVPQQFTNIVELRHRIVGKNNQKPFSLYSIHHPFFYTPQSLKKMFVLAGFRITRLSTWNSHINRGSRREKILLFLGDIMGGKGDFIDVFASKDNG
jgi:SAM-dependent methyltransferase